MYWLLDRSVLVAMENAPPLSAAQSDHAMAAIGDPRGNADRVMSVSGDTATINIAGVMTSRPSFMAFFFGGGNTLFGDIVAAARSADADPAIKRVDFAINSGGGEAQPTAAVGDVIAAMKTPTRAVVTTAASAAFWLASQADKIVAANRASRVGSIGAVQTFYKPSEAATIDVSSTNAPNKRPDPETAEGVAVVRQELDQFHDLFATAVAVGRDTTVEKVNNDFGRGGMMLAEQALAVGMIDEIAASAPAPAESQSSTKTQATGAKIMDLATLKTDHPALYEQAVATGRKEGAAAELDRVKYHLTLGNKVGAVDIAVNACLNGTGKDDGETQAEYLAAAANRSDLSDRQQDDKDLGNATDANAGPKAREAAEVNAIFQQAAAGCNVKLEG